MNFRCYACGLTFSEGLPPMEALSLEQLGAVTGDDTPEIHHDLLFGTKFEGMSTYNFCAFCLTSIRDFPLALENKQETPGHKMQFKSGDDHISYLSCECGYAIHPNVERNMLSIVINREMVMHLIEDVFYAECDLTEIRSLVNSKA